MEWIECVLPCGDDVEELCGRLEALGVEGMSLETEKDFRTFLEENRAYWDYVDEELERRFAGLSQVRFWLPRTEDGQAILQAVRQAGYQPETRFMADQDWENNWKQYYKPICVGRRLVVVPQWEEAPDTGRIPLRLDPGLIFGTGSHATTRMCLESAEDLVRPGCRVLDLGCGSGILAIGALLLGAGQATGCDIDPKAPEVAQNNAALNGLGRDRFYVLAGDVLSDAGLRRALGGGYDLVFANIVADVIIPLAPLARAFLAPGGDFICSGILEGRQAETARALQAAGFSICGHFCQEEWHCFACKADIITP